MQLALNLCTVIQLTIDKLEDECLHKSYSDNDYVMLISGKNKETRIEMLAARIRGALPEETSAQLYIIVGNTVNRFTDVVRSFNNALSLIYIHPSVAEVPVIYYDENAAVHARIFYPQDMQHHLISCLVNGDESGTLTLLRELKEKNLQTSGLPAFMRHLFIDSLLNTLLQAVSMAGFPADMVQTVYDSVNTLMALPVNDRLNEIDALFVLLCRNIVQLKNARQQIDIEKVCEYIRSNYADVNLSLTSVADRFGVSESYLSGTFKAQNGANYFTYVESLRMEKAKDLLRNTGLKISEISEQIGYASTNSFCRAFKRSIGVSDTDYRIGFDDEKQKPPKP